VSLPPRPDSDQPPDEDPSRHIAREYLESARRTHELHYRYVQVSGIPDGAPHKRNVAISKEVSALSGDIRAGLLAGLPHRHGPPPTPVSARRLKILNAVLDDMRNRLGDLAPRRLEEQYINQLGGVRLAIILQVADAWHLLGPAQWGIEDVRQAVRDYLATTQ
jgi:hypothetical protein